MRRTIWPVALGIALLSLLTLQSTNAYAQHRLGCRWWSRGYVTVWYRPGPSSSVVMPSAAGVPSSYGVVTQSSGIPVSSPVITPVVHKPIVAGLGDQGNQNFGGVAPSAHGLH